MPEVLPSAAQPNRIGIYYEKNEHLVVSPPRPLLCLSQQDLQG